MQFKRIVALILIPAVLQTSVPAASQPVAPSIISHRALFADQAVVQALRTFYAHRGLSKRPVSWMVAHSTELRRYALYTLGIWNLGVTLWNLVHGFWDPVSAGLTQLALTAAAYRFDTDESHPWNRGIDWIKYHEPELYGKTLFHVTPGIKPSPEFLRDGFSTDEQRIRVANAHQTGGLEPLITEELAKVTEMGMNGIGVSLLYDKAPFQLEDGTIESIPVTYTEAIEKGQLRYIGQKDIPVGHPDGRLEEVKTSVFAAAIPTQLPGKVAIKLLLHASGITTEIYPEDRGDQRARQMLLLGRGALVVMKDLASPNGQLERQVLFDMGLPFREIDPALLAMNEALAGLARPGSVEDGLDKDPFFDRVATFFTTHTPVETALQKFPGHFAEWMRIAKHLVQRILTPTGDLDMAGLTLIDVDDVNAVSQEHAEVTVRKLFPYLKGWIKGIVNGIYLPHWQLREMAELVGKEYTEENVKKMVHVHTQAKDRFADLIFRKTGTRPDTSMQFVAEVRRKTSFKAVDTFLNEMMVQKHRDVFCNGNQVQIFSGKPSSRDAWGKARVQEIMALSKGLIIKVDPATGEVTKIGHDDRLIGRVVYLPNLNVWEAPIIFQGADVLCMWSQKDTEASATGYMKGLVNAVLTWATRTGGPREHVKSVIDKEKGLSSDHMARHGANGVLIDDYGDDNRPSSHGLNYTRRRLISIYGENLKQKRWDTTWNRMMWNALQSTEEVDVLKALKRYATEMWGPQYRRRRILSALKAGAGDIREFTSYPVEAAVGETLRFEATIDMKGLTLDEVRVDLMFGTKTKASRWVEMDCTPTGAGLFTCSGEAILEDHGEYDFTVSVSPRDKSSFRNPEELRQASRFLRGPHAVLANGVRSTRQHLDRIRGPILQIHALSDGATLNGSHIIPAKAAWLRARLPRILQQEWAGVYLNGLLPIGPLNRRMGRNERVEANHPFYVYNDPEKPNSNRRIFAFQPHDNPRPHANGSPFATSDPRSINPDWGTVNDAVDIAQRLHAGGKRAFIDVIPNHLGIDSPLLWKEGLWKGMVHVDLRDLFQHDPALLRMMSEMDDSEFYNERALRERGIYEQVEHALRRHNLSVHNPLGYIVYYEHAGEPMTRKLIARGYAAGEKLPWADNLQWDYTTEIARRFVKDTIRLWMDRGFDIRFDMAHLMNRETFRKQWYPWEEDRRYFEKHWPNEFWDDVLRDFLSTHPERVVMMETYDALHFLGDPFYRDHPDIRSRILPLDKRLQKIVAEGEHINTHDLFWYLKSNPARDAFVMIQDHDGPTGPWHRGAAEGWERYDHFKAVATLFAFSGAVWLVDSRQMRGLGWLPSTELANGQPAAPPDVEAQLMDFHENFLVPWNADRLVQVADGDKMLDTDRPGLIALQRKSENGWVMVVVNPSRWEIDGFVKLNPQHFAGPWNTAWVFEDKAFDFRSAKDGERPTVQPAYIERTERLVRDGKYVKLAPGGIHVFHIYKYPLPVGGAEAGASGIWKRWSFSRNWSLPTIGRVEGVLLMIPFVAIFSLLMPTGLAAFLGLDLSREITTALTSMAAFTAWAAHRWLRRWLGRHHLAWGVVQFDGSTRDGAGPAVVAARAASTSFWGILPMALGFIIGGWYASAGIVLGMAIASIRHGQKNAKAAERQRVAYAKIPVAVPTPVEEAPEPTLVKPIPAPERWWTDPAARAVMILPLAETPDGDPSPYAGTSLFAHDALHYVDPAQVPDLPEGLMETQYVQDQLRHLRSQKEIPYEGVRRLNRYLLGAAFDQFSRADDAAGRHRKRAFAAWQNLLKEMDLWDDMQNYALFAALLEEMGGQAWWKWPTMYQDPESDEVKRFAEARADRIQYHLYLQWLFYEQAVEARNYAVLRQTYLIGDLPMYPAPNSAEVWKHKHQLFDLNKKAGAPEDEFAEEGQDWGNHPYQWQMAEEAVTNLWRKRIRIASLFVNGIRVDHLLGLFGEWNIPIGKRALEGEFVPNDLQEAAALGTRILEALSAEAKTCGLWIIGEDLGFRKPPVRQAIEAAADRLSNVWLYNVLGWRNAEFAAKRNVLWVDGTHDSDPTLRDRLRNRTDFADDKLHYLADLLESERHPSATARMIRDLTRFEVNLKALRNKSQLTEQESHWVQGFLHHWNVQSMDAVARGIEEDALRMMMASGHFFSITAQSLFGWSGQKNRVNTPGTIEGNWVWKAPEPVERWTLLPPTVLPMGGFALLIPLFSAIRLDGRGIGDLTSLHHLVDYVASLRRRQVSVQQPLETAA